MPSSVEKLIWFCDCVLLGVPISKKSFAIVDWVAGGPPSICEMFVPCPRRVWCEPVIS